MTNKETILEIGDYQDELLQKMEKELEEFRRWKEQELAEKMRDRMALETELEELGSELDIYEREPLTALKELGFSPDTVSALHLVPLVEIAWAEGRVTLAEFDLVLKIARSNGFDESGNAYLKLMDWLYERPSEVFFEKSLLVLREMLAKTPSEKREAVKRNLAAYCAEVYEMSDDFVSLLGFGSRITEKERKAIDRISAVLGFEFTVK